MNPTKELEGHLLTLCWSLWTELGVRGVVRHHRDCAVDLEALVVATASMAAADPRLREESLDCLLKLSSYLSVARLKNILADVTPAAIESFRPYAATFNAASRSHVKLPGSKNIRAYRFTPSKKSSPFPLLGPARTSLRLRATFGVGARAEVLGLMLSNDKRQWSALELASRARFGKLGVADVLRDLENAGIVTTIKVGNRNSHQLKAPKTLRDLVGKPAARFVPWPEAFTFLLAARALVSTATNRGEIAAAVDANHLLDDHRARMATLRLPWDKPALEHERWWASFVNWVLGTAQQLAEGDFGPELVGGG